MSPSLLNRIDITQNLHDQTLGPIGAKLRLRPNVNVDEMARMGNKMIKDYRIDFEALAWEPVMDGVRQKVVADPGTRVRLVQYSKFMAPHWCTRGHYGYILKGRFEIEFLNGTRVFEEGDGVFIPNGEAHRHKARVLSDVVTAIFVEDAEPATTPCSERATWSS